MAVVFGFMSLVHGPVMTFAHANPAGAHSSSNAVGQHRAAHHHHDSTSPAASPFPAEPQSPTVCYAFGCFIALGVVALNAPVAIRNPIGELFPAPAPALLASDIEPAIPPPRLCA